MNVFNQLSQNITEYKPMLKIGEIEYYMEEENYIYLSALISHSEFNYLDKLQMECHKKGHIVLIYIYTKNNSLLL